MPTPIREIPEWMRNSAFNTPSWKQASLPPGPIEGIGPDGMIRRVIGREGGYVNDPTDRGGETNYGISARANPGVDIKNLTPDAAAAIYKDKYFAPLQMDHLSPDAQEIAFDMSVNSGPGAAQKMIAEVGDNPEGMLAYRRQKYAGIIENDPSQAKFKNGWENRLQSLPGGGGQELMAGAMPRAESTGLEAATSQDKINQILDGIDNRSMLGQDFMGRFFAGAANAKHVPYGGGLQQIAAMFGGGAGAVQSMLKDNENMQFRMQQTRLAGLQREADREQRKTFHEEDIAAREKAANKQRNPWMKVDGGLYNWESDSFKEFGEDDPREKYMKVGDGLFNLETEQFETLPDDGTRPEWLPSHFESVKDYNQTTKSINEEARKDTKNFGVKRDYFNNTRAIVENNPNYGNYSVAEAGALVKNLEKMLDPQGAVLAAESEAYQEGAAYLKQAQKMIKQAESGGTKLTAGQIKSIVDTTNTLYKAMQDDVQKVTDRYGRRYERQGIHEDSRYQFLPMLPGIGEKVKTPLPPFDPASHGLTPIINKNRSTP